MDTGWVKIYRSLIGWEWYTDSKTLRLWVHILLNVNYEQKRWKGRVIQPGEMVTSIAHLAEGSGLSVRSVRTALEHLKMTGEVTCETTNKYTVIKVVKWADFQGDDSLTDKQNDTQADTQVTNKRQTNDKQTTTTKEYKEIKNEKKVRNRFIKPSLQEVTQYISENDFTIDPESFYDYYEANGWTISGRKMKDWQATCRNWQRREKPQTTKSKGDWSFEDFI